MTSADACKFIMPFGKHRGKPLREIVTDDPDGARYLDWVAGLSNLRPETAEALKVFLAIPWVAKEVDDALRDSHDYDEPPENADRPPAWWERQS